ncbi:DUF2917 domain-containing protein [Myxococcus hansupus]|uniref:DUF2917 domain-containing protein n=1 Tax=Pseudomyxococcus hansupus TaxID=1297742 RepID=UPI000272AEB5|nr:DUF2917 domain-containing protein [Myxococcus hansupus]
MWNGLRTVANRLRFGAAPARRTGRVRLPQGGLWSVRTPGGEPLELLCGDGLLWLTREGDTKDHVLRPGDTCSLDHPGHVVVQALRPSTFCLAQRLQVLRPRQPSPQATGVAVPE